MCWGRGSSNLSLSEDLNVFSIEKLVHRRFDDITCFSGQLPHITRGGLRVRDILLKIIKTGIYQ